MAKAKIKDPPVFHRLTVDLEPETYKKLKAMAEDEERSASKQAKVIIKTAVDDFMG